MEAKLLKAAKHVNIHTGIMYRYVYRETEHTRPHYHDYFEIFWVIEGSLKHVLENATVMLHPGDIVFIRPEDKHDHVVDNDNSYVFLNITFTEETAYELFHFLGDGFPSKELLSAAIPPTVHLSSSELSALNDRMRTISAIPLDDIETLKTSLRIELFHILTNCFSRKHLQADMMPLWLDDLCNRMRQGGFVEGTEKMFTLTNRSREHVCRSIKKYLGVTVTEFVNELRLSFIANMLVNSNYTVTKIVFDSGFDNISWASLLFKRKYGMTMRQYRDRK